MSSPREPRIVACDGGFVARREVAAADETAENGEETAERLAEWEGDTLGSLIRQSGY